METRTGEGVREKSRRPVRNKRYNRRAYGEEKRPPKRLFTPEIKRFLKDWLIRRRDNPYPNRDEKKMLAVQTGLTYIQVCNWFANWRRKLKNAGKEPQRKTWGDLIKSYNNQVQGNVEHFSICSEDSIWEEPEDFSTDVAGLKIDHNYGNMFSKSNPDTLGQSFKRLNFNNNSNDIQNQCYYVSSTTESEMENPFSQTNSKYKNQIMEKYLRDCHNPGSEDNCKSSMISKWLESAANFKPSEESYLDWTFCKDKKKRSKKPEHNDMNCMHGREELDAAEALTTLANSSRSYKV